MVRTSCASTSRSLSKTELVQGVVNGVESPEFGPRAPSPGVAMRSATSE